jgi:hypothetical protein
MQDYEFHGNHWQTVDNDDRQTFRVELPPEQELDFETNHQCLDLLEEIQFQDQQY